MSNSLDPDRPDDLGPNCLQRLSAYDTRRQSQLHAFLLSAAMLFVVCKFFSK